MDANTQQPTVDITPAVQNWPPTLVDTSSDTDSTSTRNQDLQQLTDKHRHVTTHGVNVQVLTDHTRGQHALYDSVSDADIHRVDDHRRSLSPVSASCTRHRSESSLSVHSSNQ